MFFQKRNRVDKRSIFMATALMFALSSIAGADESSSLSSTGKPQIVDITLKEWKIRMNKRTVVRAGAVTFRVKNTGGEDHELVIVKTELGYKDFPTTEGKVDEDAVGQLIGEIEEFPPSETREKTFILQPGNYALFCNMVEKESEEEQLEEDHGHAGKGDIESHYEPGMRIPFTVH